jgi:hypothetical protein
MNQLVITTDPTYLSEGLFGQVMLFIMEILPSFENIEPRPYFEIKSLKYGNAPDFMVVPGAFDQVTTKQMNADHISLQYLRTKENLYVLGDDFNYANSLFTQYFLIPETVTELVDNFITMSPNTNFNNTLGIHYRGTDKNTDFTQTNPVSMEYMCSIVSDILKEKPYLNQIYLATDENEFISFLKTRLQGTIPVLSCGETVFWKAIDPENNISKAKEAVRDCVLLSKCKIVVKCQSALSAFSKVLNPSLEIYRISASKKFCDIPYWPDAYIPIYESEDVELQQLIEVQLADDWTKNETDFKKFFNFDKMIRMSS